MERNDVRHLIPVSIAVLTVSDTRTEDNDQSGHSLVRLLTESGHRLAEKAIVSDNIYTIRSVLSKWIDDSNIQTIITTGGTGICGRDGSIEAVLPLFDKKMDGFGELFRMLSYDEIGTSTLQSRATAGVANGTYMFVLPGSTGACQLAWKNIISFQLDWRTRPCNLIEIIPRLLES